MCVFVILVAVLHESCSQHRSQIYSTQKSAVFNHVLQPRVSTTSTKVMCNIGLLKESVDPWTAPAGEKRFSHVIDIKHMYKYSICMHKTASIWRPIAEYVTVRCWEDDRWFYKVCSLLQHSGRSCCQTEIKAWITTMSRFHSKHKESRWPRKPVHALLQLLLLPSLFC